ncbi:MAG: hypothetical protein Q7U12_02620 [Undibacterium sp.]|nr:hypothetical protein [Undibacterium sp.]
MSCASGSEPRSPAAKAKVVDKDIAKHVADSANVVNLFIFISSGFDTLNNEVKAFNLALCNLLCQGTLCVNFVKNGKLSRIKIFNEK